MSHRILVLLLIFIAIFPPTSEGATIDLPGTAERVRQSNPSLKAARLAIAEAEGRLLGAGRLTNPTLNFEQQAILPFGTFSYTPLSTRITWS